MWRLARWHDQQMAKMTKLSPHDMVDPLWTVMAEGGPYHALHEPGRSPLPEYIERLKTTGRSDGAERLAQKYSQYLPKREE
jgi:hypothetical protein